MVLKVQDAGHARDIPIRAGELFTCHPAYRIRRSACRNRLAWLSNADGCRMKRTGCSGIANDAITSSTRSFLPWVISSKTFRPYSTASMRRTMREPAASVAI